MNMIAFKITKSGNLPHATYAKSLDEMTRELPMGFYTTFSTLSGGTKVLGLHTHLQRLYIPALELGLVPSVNESTLRIRLAELAKTNLPKESRIRLILTKDNGTIYVGIQPFEPLPESVYYDGVHVITSNVSRSDPRIKGTDFITQSAEQRKLVKGDVFEVLLTHDGKILEGMTSNFYVIARAKPEAISKHAGRLLRRQERPARNDVTLITAQKGILLGVTRRAVLRLARGEGMSIEYRAPEANGNFDEAFLTSSSRGVVPIVSIDGSPVGEGRRRAEPVEAVGDWTKRLMKAYREYVERKAEEIGN
ncbi:putative branched-chain-amino-acid aminotransferase [Anaerolineales bacterium]|nr:putative branched-chain-amino-acid aminotransferase [Anaerolineales bacterium]